MIDALLWAYQYLGDFRGAIDAAAALASLDAIRRAQRAVARRSASLVLRRAALVAAILAVGAANYLIWRASGLPHWVGWVL